VRFPGEPLPVDQVICGMTVESLVGPGNGVTDKVALEIAGD
jgi:hypothetical protein